MQSQRMIETLVGLFVVLAILSLSTLAFKISGLTSLFPEDSYTVTALFDDIGGLKIKAPIKMGGVPIGQVGTISLDPVTYKAIVKMQIFSQFNDIPDDSSAGIYTAGLLGDNYISISPMYSKTFLKAGSTIEMTNSAMVLEKLIGQFMYKLGNTSNTSNTTHTASDDKISDSHPHNDKTKGGRHAASTQ